MMKRDKNVYYLIGDDPRTPMDPTLLHRFLGVASSASSDGNGDELNEDDVLWTTDFTEQSSVQSTTTTTATNDDDNENSRNHNHCHGRASLPQVSGIIAALPERNRQSVLYRKPSVPAYSSRKSIPWIPKPAQSEREYAWQLMPAARKMNQSAPMNVPLLSVAMAKQRNSKFRDDEDGGENDEEMLPPHEIVARRSPKTAFSVLEGVGRTLKGRDLRQVRNAVWRQTGFLD